jgi:hypothetical protein
MRLHAPWIFFALTLVGCGGNATDDAASSSGGNTEPFIGVYDGTYSGTSMTTSPPMPANSDTGTGMITVEPGMSTDLKMTISLTAPEPSTCIGLFAQDGNSATFSPPQQNCNLMFPDGRTQTNTNSADATVSGSTLTIHVYGSFTGMAMGSPYSGTFDGTWTATRR